MAKVTRRFDASRVETLRRALCEQGLVPFYGSRYEGENARELDRVLADTIKCPIRVITKSVTDLSGHILSEGRLDRVVYRLVSNYPQLRKGKAVPCWTGMSREASWIPLEIRAVNFSKGSKVPGLSVIFRALGGPPAYETCSTFWSKKMTSYAAYKVLGFRRGERYSEYAYRHPREVTGLRLWGLLDSEKTSFDNLVFSEYGDSAAFLRFNRELMAKRNRKGFQCPKKLTNRCYACRFGYDLCPVATHPKTYEEKVEDDTDKQLHRPYNQSPLQY